jgi:tetratricopeptide (TPR) repeat protein
MTSSATEGWWLAAEMSCGRLKRRWHLSLNQPQLYSRLCGHCLLINVSCASFLMRASCFRGVVQGDIRGAIKAYGNILSLSCPEQLVWRCHTGRSLALLARGEHTAALADADRALELAEVQEIAADKARHAKEQAASAASSKKTDAQVIEAARPSTAEDDYLLDPFLSLPQVSLALLHYRRGLILDAFSGDQAQPSEALAAFRRADELEPARHFLVGHVARKQFEARLQQVAEGESDGSPAASAESQGVRAEEEGKQAPVSKGAQKRPVTSSAVDAAAPRSAATH